MCEHDAFLIFMIILILMHKNHPIQNFSLAFPVIPFFPNVKPPPPPQTLT